MSLAFRVILAFLKACFFLWVSYFSSRVIQGWLYLVVVILQGTQASRAPSNLILNPLSRALVASLFGGVEPSVLFW